MGIVRQVQGQIVGSGSRKGEENSVSLSAMYPHRIRLRGPWECEPIEPSPLVGQAFQPDCQARKPDLRDGEGRVLPHRVILPCRWIDAGLVDFQGSVRFTRKFGYPGRV